MSFRHVTLTDEQSAAADRICSYLSNPEKFTPFSLHGLAGTGKTSTMAEIAAAIPHAILCCLTGKAASVLRRKTGLDVTTIHSAFYRLKNVSLDENGREVPHFNVKHARGELADKIILIDESSMINEWMMSDIRRTGGKIVGSGDPGQLPPVEGEQFFNWADVTLQTIHRQALESPIIRQAHAVRESGRYQPDGDDFRVLREACSDQQYLDANVILVQKNTTRHNANTHVRQIRGLTGPPRINEPMLCKKNVPWLGIFNGGVYPLVRDFTPGDAGMWLDVDGDVKMVPGAHFEDGYLAKTCSPMFGPSSNPKSINFEFGYALTVHKAQGSEWGKVLLIDEYGSRDNGPRWRYTAITRASKQIIITPILPPIPVVPFTLIPKFNPLPY